MDECIAVLVAYHDLGDVIGPGAAHKVAEGLRIKLDEAFEECHVTVDDTENDKENGRFLFMFKRPSHEQSDHISTGVKKAIESLIVEAEAEKKAAVAKTLNEFRGQRIELENVDAIASRIMDSLRQKPGRGRQA